MILQGDCRDVLPTLEAESVQCCVTSPPYWGLRDYGVSDQIGLEATPEDYVAALVEVFREVRRVLRPDGTLWLNLGDSYSRHTGNGDSFDGKHGYNSSSRPNRLRSESQGSSDGKVGRGDRAPVRNGALGIKPKDLVGIPWRVAFALQADGWYLRSDIIWHKPNPMPESVTDRPTKAHEYIFLLSKSERYFYDAEAIAEPAGYGHEAKWDNGQNGHGGGESHKGQGSSTRKFKDTGADAPTRNARSVWTVPTRPYAEAHFATFPTEIARRCILAGSRPGDTVLDPFNGAATTGLVAQENHREYVGIELNPDYIRISDRRLAQNDSPSGAVRFV